MSLVCSVCGVAVVKRSDGAAFHADALPDQTEYHAADPVDVTTLGQPETSTERTPSERLANAAERIADALEKLVEQGRRKR